MSSLITRQLPALFNGVSQQPAVSRLATQCESQVNCYSTPADGVRKRPPFEHVARLAGDWSTAYLHGINRDVSERYIVAITDGDLKVFDTLGNEKTVTFPEGKGYLDIPTGANAQRSFAVVSIADYSFIVNKTMVVATKAAPTVPPSNYANSYRPASWKVNDDIPYYNTPQGTFKGTKQVFTDLPKAGSSPAPQEGDTWKVSGYDENGFGGYYVVRRGGVWEETFAPGDNIGIDENSMPHALVRNADGTFTFTIFPWKVRKFGDKDSNPPPSFVGRPINDVFYFKNRLGLMSDENCVFSCAGDFGNFWRNTVTTLLDSDVVDVAVSSTKVSILNYAVPTQTRLMMFADQSQFVLNVDELLTPSSVSIDTVTEYEMSTLCRPANIGTEVYFPTEVGRNSRIREYFVDMEANASDAADVTAHVPRYVPRNIIKMAGNAGEDVLFCLSSDEPRRIYVYKFQWQGDEKTQSCWNYWEFGPADTILSMEIMQNVLYVFVQRTDGVYLEKCDVQSGALTGDLTTQVLLDRLAPVQGIYQAVEGRTWFQLPYPVPPAYRSTFRVVRGSGFGSQTLSLIDPSQYVWGDDSNLYVPGDHTAGVVWIGQSYVMEYVFSEQFLKTGQDISVTTGRLMLRTFVVYYADTAFFKTSVSPYGIAPLVESVVPAGLNSFTGRTLGEASLKLNTPLFSSGRYAFQVHGDSKVARISLLNDTHVQSKFVSAEWEALYHNRARPL